MNPRIVELALEMLETKKAEIDKEIAELKGSLGSKPAAAAPGRPRRRVKTAAQRKAHSEAMRAYWAKKKAAARREKKA
jgi:hypothetical protein